MFECRYSFLTPDQDGVEQHLAQGLNTMGGEGRGRGGGGGGEGRGG